MNGLAVAILSIWVMWALSFNAEAQTVVAHEQRDYVVFAPLPMEEARLVIERSQGLTQFLQELLQRPVHIRYIEDYDEILQAFRRGEIDIAHLGPFNYVMLKEQAQQAQPLVALREADGADYYRCVLVSAIDGVVAIADIDHSFALTQPLSTCGPFMASDILAQHDVNLYQLNNQFLGTHDEVALAVVRKEFQAGMLSAAIAQKYQPLGLNVLQTSQPLPLFALAGNTETLSSEEFERIRQALLQLSPQQREQWGLGQQGFVAADDADYDVIRALKDANHVH